MLKIPVWIPIKSLGAINVYAFSNHDNTIDLVDSGTLSGRSILSLINGLRGGGLDPCKITNIYITHFHVDHSTLSLLINKLTGAKLYIGEKDFKVIRNGVEKFVWSALELFIHNGMSREEAKEIFNNHPAVKLKDTYAELLDIDWALLKEGDRISLGGEAYRVLELPGHTPGHIGFYNEENKILFSGDVVLENITPHVTIHDWKDNPLEDYLNTLKRILELSPSIIYPGHRSDIRDPAKRIRELLSHHQERLQNILDILRREGRLTGYEIAKKVKWRVRYNSWDEYPYSERFFAMGEALAHLRYLEVKGLVERRNCGEFTCFRNLT